MNAKLQEKIKKEGYNKKIIFNPGFYTWPLRGIVMAHFAQNLLISLILEFKNKGVLNNHRIEIRPTFGYAGSTSQAIEIHSQTCIHPDEEIKVVFDILDSHNIDIIWKEGNYGYKIKKDGTILEKWVLDDGGC